MLLTLTQQDDVAQIRNANTHCPLKSPVCILYALGFISRQHCSIAVPLLISYGPNPIDPSQDRLKPPQPHLLFDYRDGDDAKPCTMAVFVVTNYNWH